jgi:hypothetical protein
LKEVPPKKRPKTWGSIPGKGRFDSWQGREIFLFSLTSRLALQPIQPPVKWVLVAVSPVVKQQGCEMTTHLHLVLRLRMVELYLHSPIHLHGMVLNPRDNFTFYLYLQSANYIQYAVLPLLLGFRSSDLCEYVSQVSLLYYMDSKSLVILSFNISIFKCILVYTEDTLK